jgi:act minimal PKS acyl carrier protein
MQEFTLGHLNRIMREVGGEDDLNGETADTTFSDLGFDSLAVLEIAARIAQDFMLVLSDDAADQLETPSNAVTVVNSLLADVR